MRPLNLRLTRSINILPLCENLQRQKDVRVEEQHRLKRPVEGAAVQVNETLTNKRFPRGRGIEPRTNEIRVLAGSCIGGEARPRSVEAHVALLYRDSTSRSLRYSYMQIARARYLPCPVE